MRLKAHLSLGDPMKENRQDRFMELYTPVHSRFERFCKARAYGELDFRDLMQDTILTVYDKLDQLKSDAAFLPYLFSTSIKILANQKRKKRPHYVDVYPEKSIAGQNDAPPVELQLEIKDLYSRMSLLDALTRECLILFEVSGFSIKEIMEILNMGESAVKQRLSRGRKELLELMQTPARKTA